MKKPLPLCAIMFSLIAFGQGPISDRLVVTLPNTTWIGSHSLAAGKYTIRQLPTASSPRLLEFSSENGTTFEVAITTIAAIDNNNTRSTSVILKQLGDDFHLSQVWVAGKTYGYELPVDQSKVLARKSETVTLAATFVPAPQEVSSAQPPPAAPAPAEVEKAPAAVVEKAPEKAPETAPIAVVTPVEAPPQATPAPEPQVTAQVTPPAAPEQPQDRTATDNSQLAAQTPLMPETASYWAELLLSGLVLMALGMLLLQRRAGNS